MTESYNPAEALNRITSRVPTLAIIGRPNVGKSTLFNRLLGRRQSIVHNLPGVTRDRIAGRTLLADDFPVELVDTGGLVPGDDPLGLSAQVFLAIEESDLLLLVVDGKEGLTTADETVAANLRRFAKNILVVVNKADTRLRPRADQRVPPAGHGRADPGLGRARRRHRRAAGSGAGPLAAARAGGGRRQPAFVRHRRPAQRGQVVAGQQPARRVAGAGLAGRRHHPRSGRFSARAGTTAPSG